MQKEIFLEQLGSLVEMQTYPGDMEINSQALDLIESWASSGCKSERIINGNAEILLIGNGDLLNPDVGYLVHVDVVKGNDDQFRIRTEGDIVFGRGVSDMKFSIPVGMALLNKLTEMESGKSMTFAITTDEEVGGGEGGRYLAETVGFRPKVLIVPDGGDGFVLVNRSKGVVHIWVESCGKPAHASEPWMGVNALNPLCKLATELLKKYESNSYEENWNTTMNLGYLTGGKSANQVCPEALIKIDFRFPESRSVEEIFEEVVSIAEKIDKNLKVTIGASGDPTFTDIEVEAINKLMTISKEVLGKKMEVIGECGASDARHWAKYNIPIIMTKPVGGGFHSDNEWIDVESCLLFYRLLERYIADM